MCNFFSSILTIDDQFLYLESSDSHEDIVEFYNLKDNGKAFVRGEFKPDSINDYTDVEKYKFFLDETSAPAWLTDEMTERWIDRCKGLLKNRIITEGVINLLIDKFYILGGSVVVKKAKNCIIKSASGNCVIESAYDNCIIKSASGNCIIKSASGNCIIESAYDNCIIKSASGNCIIKSASGNCVIESASGNCVIEQKERIKNDHR